MSDEIDINKIRALSDQALRDKQAREPHELSHQELEELLNTVIQELLKGIEIRAAEGRRIIGRTLTAGNQGSYLLGSYYRTGDFKDTGNLGYYSKKYLKYFSDPNNLIRPARTIYDGVYRHFTRAGFSVNIEFYDFFPSDDSPVPPSICIRW